MQELLKMVRWNSWCLHYLSQGSKQHLFPPITLSLFCSAEANRVVGSLIAIPHSEAMSAIKVILGAFKAILQVMYMETSGRAHTQLSIVYLMSTLEVMNMKYVPGSPPSLAGRTWKWGYISSWFYELCPSHSCNSTQWKNSRIQLLNHPLYTWHVYTRKVQSYVHHTTK